MHVGLGDSLRCSGFLSARHVSVAHDWRGDTAIIVRVCREFVSIPSAH